VHDALPAVGMNEGPPLTTVPAAGNLNTVKASWTSEPAAPNAVPARAAMARLSLWPKQPLGWFGEHSE
jgi:hypothetical protein